MKAVVYERYGAPDVLTIADIPKPVPGEHDILIRMRASCVNSADIRMRAFDVPPQFRLIAKFMLGWPAPKNRILGVDFAGEVEAVGSAVTRFAPGDRVFGLSVYNCHAEYKLVRDTASIAKIPDGLSFEQAAALPFGGHTALHFLEKPGIRPGQKVLVSGASSAIGVIAVQIAKAMGAEVTAVTSGRNAELVRSLGAVQAIDYTTPDFTRNGVAYDVIFDTIGTLSFDKIRGSLKPQGWFLSAVLGGRDMLPRFGISRKIVGGEAKESAAAIETLARMVEAGTLKPVIDKTWPLEEVSAAHAYVDSKRKRGAVVLALT